MADTDIFFLLKSDVHAGGVVSQLLGHANTPAECDVVRFLTQKKHIGISLRKYYESFGGWPRVDVKERTVSDVRANEGN